MIDQKNKTGGGTITWTSDDWRGGLGPEGKFNANNTLKMTNPNGFAGLQKIDPFFNYGVLGPAIAPSANFTNNSVLAGPIVATQFINNSNMYAVDSGGKVHYVQFAANSITNGMALGVSWPNTITGTTPVAQDCLLYRHNNSGTSVVSLFYSYYNAVNWNVGCFTNQTVFEDTYMSGGGGTAPATPLDISSTPGADGRDIIQKSAPHPLCIGADGLLYIGSGRYIHAYDGNTGTNGTFSSRVLTLPQGFQLIAMRKYQDQLLIAGNYYSNQGSGADGTGEAQCYVWNYVDLDITAMIPLEDPFVSAIFLWKGTPTVITNGKAERNGENKIKTITGNSVTKIADFDGVVPIQRGIIVANDVLYLNAGGKIVTIGDKFVPSSSANHIASFSSTGVSGALIYNYLQGSLLGSASTGSVHCINNINNGFDSGVAFPFYYEPNFPTGHIGKINSVEIEFFNTLVAAGGNGNLTLTLLTDYNIGSTTILANMASVAAPLKKRYFLDSSGVELPTFSSIGPEFIWAGGVTGVPLISSISVEYTSVVSDSNS